MEEIEKRRGNKKREEKKEGVENKKKRWKKRGKIEIKESGER
nr:hypothetical protein [Lactiplantibacillus plantarum]